VLAKISQDQISRRILLLLRCPVFAGGMTSTEIGTNLEKGKESHRSVVLPRLIEYESSDWLYDEVLRRKDNLLKWEIDWDEVLDSRDGPKIDAARSKIQGELLSFLYYV